MVQILLNLIILLLGIVLLYFGFEYSLKNKKTENYVFGIFLFITGFILIFYSFGLIKIW